MFYAQVTDKYDKHSEVQLSSDTHRLKKSSVPKR